MSKHAESVKQFLSFTGKGDQGPLSDNDWKILWKNDYAPWHSPAVKQ